jgi:integral membrane protein (TIGR01906 family)
MSGYAKEEIILNYNALMNWCMPWVNAKFALPTFPSSTNAIIHFEEVKAIFNIVLAAGFFSAIPLFVLSYRAKKYKKCQRFIVAGSITLTIPVLLGSYVALDFNNAFVFFHEMVFRNELWIFDYKTDPVITILPEAYFMHCLIVILSVVVLGSVGLFLLGRRKDL